MSSVSTSSDCVVVIDDQPEVTIDDPAFLFENNDGFQEVTSKKTLKIKLKQEAEQQKKTEQQTQQLKKRESANKVIARPKGLSPKINRSSHNSKSNKLPPRLAKQKEQREKEKEMNKNIMAHIEQWDNDMAISIPFQQSSATDDKGELGVNPGGPTVSVMSAPNSALVKLTPLAAVSIASPTTPLVSLAPAPPPPISAWAKPISFAATVGTSASSVAAVSSTVTVSSSLKKTVSVAPATVSASLPPAATAVSVSVADCGKFDKGDQHDSGIDVSDGQPNSAASSTRSSPSADNKLKDSEAKVNEKILVSKLKAAESAAVKFEAPKPPRQPKVVSRSGEKAGSKTAEASANVKVIQKPVPEPSKDKAAPLRVVDLGAKPEPIQMPPSFKDPIFGKGSDIQLAFGFDSALKPLDRADSGPSPAEARDERNEVTFTPSVASITSPTSPATRDLNSKIASCKNCWELPTVFEQKSNSLSGSGALGTSLSVVGATTTITVSSVASSGPSFSTFTTTAQVSIATPPSSSPMMHKPASLSPAAPDNMAFASAADRTADSMPFASAPDRTADSMVFASAKDSMVFTPAERKESIFTPAAERKDNIFTPAAERKDNIFTPAAERKDNIFTPAAERKDNIFTPAAERKDNIFTPAAERKDNIFTPAAERKDNIFTPAAERKDNIFTPAAERKDNIFTPAAERKDNIFTPAAERNSLVFVPSSGRGGENMFASAVDRKGENMVFVSAMDRKGDHLDHKHQAQETMASHHGLTEASNVCKVRPQQLRPAESGGGGTEGAGGMSMSMSMAMSMSSLGSSLSGSSMPAVPSPPIMLTQGQAYQPFLLPQETRFPQQASYGFGLTQQPQPSSQQPQLAPQPPMSQPSLFLPTQQDLFAPFQRSHGPPAPTAPPTQQGGMGGPQAAAFGQQTNMNTVMVSSANSTLMSTSIKPGPNPNAAPFNSAVAKNLGPSQLPFNQGLNSMNNNPMPLSQMFFLELAQPLGQLFGPNQLLGNAVQTSQSLNSSQIIPSQLVQQPRSGVQNVQAVQPSSSFYQQPQPNLTQTGFFPTQQSASTLQGGLQPPQGTAQFSMQPFGNQPHGLGLTLHSPAPGASLSQPLGLGPAPGPGPGPTPQHQAPPQHHSQAQHPHQHHNQAPPQHQHQHQAPPQQQHQHQHQQQTNKGSQFGNIMQQQMSSQSAPLKSPPSSLGHGQGNMGHGQGHCQTGQGHGQGHCQSGQGHGQGILGNNKNMSAAQQQQQQVQQQQQQQQQQQMAAATKNFNAQMNSRNTAQRFPPPAAQAGPKFGHSPFIQQSMQTPGPMVRPQLMMSSMMPGNMAPPAPRPNFPNPIQRPTGPPPPPATTAQQRTPSMGVAAKPLGGGVSPGLGLGLGLGPRPPTQPQALPPQPPSASGSHILKAQHFKARQDLLAHMRDYMGTSKPPSVAPGVLAKTPTPIPTPASSMGASAPMLVAAAAAAPKADASGDGKKSMTAPLPLMKAALSSNTPTPTSTAAVVVSGSAASSASPKGQESGGGGGGGGAKQE